MEEEEEKLQQGVKKAGKLAGKQVGKAVGKVIKKMGAAIIGAVIQFLPYILVSILITSFVAAIIKYVTVSNGSYVAGAEENIPNVIEEALKDIEIERTGYNIDLDQKVEEVIATINKDSNQLYAYISEEKQKEYLKTFIKADFITQNFKIGTADPKNSNALNGAITVKRSDQNGKISTLQYLDYETFKNYITESNSEVFKYFSTNEDGQLVIAQSYNHSKVLDTNIPGEESTNVQEYTISEMALDYKSALSSYAMPFNFLWALLVKSTEEDFVYELAKLALDTEITITAYDNYMRTEETEDSTFAMNGKKELKIRQLLKHTGKTTIIDREQNFDTADTTYHRKLTEITETRNVTVNVTYANTWIAKYQNEYTYEAIPESVTNNDIEKGNGALQSIDREMTKAELAEDSFAKQVLNDLEHEKVGDEVYTILSGRITAEIKENTRTGKIISFGNTYKEGTPQVEEKTDINAKEPNFCTILKKYPRAEEKIMSAVDWLFEMMENNTENVTNMIDLIKYLLYKATGQDLGVTELGSSFFIINNFSSMYSGGINVNKTNISKEDFVKCVKEYRKNDSGYQRRFADYADKIYDICVKNNINPILCVAQAGQESSFGESTPINSKWNYWGLGVYNESSVGTTFATIDEAIEFYCKTILSYQKPGSIAYTKAQVYAPHSDKITGSMNSIYDVLCAYMYLGDKHSGIVYGNVNVKRYLTHYMNYDCKHQLEESTTLEEQAAYVVDYIDNRVISIAKDIFGNKIYSGGSIVEVADMIHKYMEQNNYTYCVLNNSNEYEECKKYGKAHGLNRTFEESKTGYHNTCCATYVSWVLQMAGYIEDSDHSDGAETLAALLQNKYGWKRVSSAEAQAGDILYYTEGHIEIYAGNNKKYNAGSGEAIRKASPYDVTISPSTIVLRAP